MEEYEIPIWEMATCRETETKKETEPEPKSPTRNIRPGIVVEKKEKNNCSLVAYSTDDLHGYTPEGEKKDEKRNYFILTGTLEGRCPEEININGKVLLVPEEKKESLKNRLRVLMPGTKLTVLGYEKDGEAYVYDWKLGPFFGETAWKLFREKEYALTEVSVHAE